MRKQTPKQILREQLRSHWQLAAGFSLAFLGIAWVAWGDGEMDQRTSAPPTTQTTSLIAAQQ